MNKLFKVLTGLSCFLLTLVFTMSHASSLTRKDAEGASFGIRPATTYTMTLYTDYDGSNWGSANTINVVSGNAISSATNPTKSGYTFMGWRTFAPVNSTGVANTDFPVQYTTNQLNSITPTENMSFYPIFKYNSKQVYTYSNNAHHYYDVNADVTINYQTLGSTYIGDRYLGVLGVTDATGTYYNNRNLITSSGVYRFKDDGGCSLERKIGLRISDSAGGDGWNKETTERYRIYYFNNSSDNGWTDQITRTNQSSPYTCYFYISITYANIIFCRMNTTGNTGFNNVWNQSNDIALASNYSSSAFINSKNQGTWSNWSGTWIS